MTSKVINSQSSKANNSTANSSLKLLLFDIGKLHLSLSVDQVQKVTKYQSVHSSGLNHVGISHLGNLAKGEAMQDVTIVDLHKKLFHTSQIDPSEGKGYFIITKPVVQGESLGIIVTKAPTLIDVPVEQIRVLPNSYRHADTLVIASHVTLIPQADNNSLTVFILDLQQLICVHYFANNDIK
jgi:purine-binding chemotaxis protein CheW